MDDSKITFEQAKIEHVDALKGKLRKSDILEIKAVTGSCDDSIMVEAFLSSKVCWTAFKDGKPIAIFGVCKIDEKTGSPWFLGTKEVDRCGKDFVRNSLYYLNEVKSHFNYLENYIDVRQKKSIRWLRWLKFNIDHPVVYGVEKLLFHRFWI